MSPLRKWVVALLLGFWMPPSSAREYPALGNLRLEEGTVEMWVTFKSDPAERSERFRNGFDILRLCPDAKNRLWLFWKQQHGLSGPYATVMVDGKKYIPFWEHGQVNSLVGNWKRGERHHLAYAWRGPKTWWIIDGKRFDGTREKQARNTFPMTFELATDTVFTVGGKGQQGEVGELRVSSVARREDEVGYHCPGKLTADEYTLLLNTPRIPSTGTPAAVPRIERLPTVGIPLMSTAPQIDGKVGVREWTGAAQLPALVSAKDGMQADARTDVFVAHTTDELLLAFRCHRDAAWGPPRTVQDTGRDGLVWRDDHVELFLVPRESPTKPAINFAGNAAGIVGDGLTQPPTDKSKDWDWRYKTRLTHFGWEGEIAIAFEDLGVEAPTRGAVWRFDFVRNQATPGRFQSFLSYRSRWHNHDLFSRLVFAGEAPAVRMTESGRVAEDGVGLLGEIINATDKPQLVTVRGALHKRIRDLDGPSFFSKIDSGISAAGEAEPLTMATAAKQIKSVLGDYKPVKARSWKREVPAHSRVPLQLFTTGVGKYLLAYDVMSADGKVLQRAALPFVRPLPLDLEVTPYYIRSKVIFVRLQAHSQRSLADVETIQYTLRQDGEPRLTRRVVLAEATDGVDLDVSDIGTGGYTIEATPMDSAGSARPAIRRELQKPPLPHWATERYGLKRFVPRPWTPVQADGRQVRVLNRQYDLASGPLVSQATVLGEPLLASPAQVSLWEGGQQHTLTDTLRQTEATDEEAVYEWTGAAGPIAASARIAVEFDGLITIDLTLEPGQRAIERMAVEFPLKSEAAQLYTIHNYLRTFSKSTKLPPSRGEAGEGFQIPVTAALWLGNTEKGFQWCTESDQHWHVQDRKNCIDVEPLDNGSTILRLRVIDKPYRPGRRISYRWGLIATPSRTTLPQFDHRLRFFQTNAPAPTYEDRGERVLDLARKMGVNWWNFFHWNTTFGQPICEDAEVVRKVREAVKLVNAEGINVVGYAGWGVSTDLSFWPSFGRELIRTPSRYSHNTYGQCTRSPFEDYLANGLVWMIKTLGYRGVYLDSTAWPPPCSDPHHGCGYVDAETGKRVTTVSIWATRRLFKRMYKILHGEVIDGGLLYSHAGQSPLMAIESFVDVKHQGEGAYYTKSLKDFFSLAQYRAHYNPKQYGYVVEHTWNNKATIARNSVWGLALLHDNAIKMYYSSVLNRPYNRANDYSGRRGIDWRMWRPRQWFDWRESHWHPYYDNADVISVTGEDIHASVHTNPKAQVLLCLMNMGQRDQTVEATLSIGKLKLPATLYGRDVVTRETFRVSAGRFRIAMRGERPRIVLLAPQPVSFGPP